jgi:hypothetical protein
MVMAFSFALAKAGNNMPAKMAMIAMTTNNSIKVNAARLSPDLGSGEFIAV